jgi:hypothetical protein
MCDAIEVIQEATNNEEKKLRKIIERERKDSSDTHNPD